MITPVVQTFDHRQQMIVFPSEIKPGDWLRDLGRLRQVKSVETMEDTLQPETLHLIHFVDEQTADYGSLGVRALTRVTIWRDQLAP